MVIQAEEVGLYRVQCDILTDMLTNFEFSPWL